MVETVESRNWPTSIWRIASTTSARLGSGPTGSSSANALSQLDLPGPHLLGVDLAQRGALAEPLLLALGRVPLGEPEVAGGPRLLGDRRDPLEQLLEPRPRRHGLAAVEVDQLARKAVADRPPEVLLEQPPRPVGQRLALVVGPRAPHRERVGEGGEGGRVAELGLRVHDP